MIVPKVKVKQVDSLNMQTFLKHNFSLFSILLSGIFYALVHITLNEVLAGLNRPPMLLLVFMTHENTE